MKEKLYLNRFIRLRIVYLFSPKEPWLWVNVIHFFIEIMRKYVLPINMVIIPKWLCANVSQKCHSRSHPYLQLEVTMKYSLSLHIYPIYLGRHQLHLLYFSITPPPLPLIISKFYIQRQQQRNSIETQKAAKTSLMQFLFHIFFLFFSFFLLRELLH